MCAEVQFSDSGASSHIRPAASTRIRVSSSSHGLRETQGTPEPPGKPGRFNTAIDDRTRIAYSETCTDEKGATAAAFWQRAAAWFAQLGFARERALTDNGACYRSDAFKTALAATATTHKTTRPYRPQTNGKVERFHRILIKEWAYIRDWTNDTGASPR